MMMDHDDKINDDDRMVMIKRAMMTMDDWMDDEDE